MRTLVVVLALAVVAGCTKTNPLDCSDGKCADPAHPYCDTQGVEGAPNVCIAVSCSAPSEFVTCQGDNAVSCNQAGDGYDLTPCATGCSAAAHGCNLCTPDSSYCTATGIQHCGSDGAPTTFDQCSSGCSMDPAPHCLMCTPDSSYCTSTGIQHCGSDGAPTTFDQCSNGCSMDPAPHCLQIVPRYLGDACDTEASADLDIASNATLGTDLDTACNGGIIHQTAAPDICVVRNKSITIESAATLRASGSRLLALVADTELNVHGTLDASADMATSGPAGCFRASGGGTGSVGGGGAGFHTAGGDGGNATTDGGAANAGAATTDPAQLAVLTAGACAPSSGGGGGGVTLVACRGKVTIDGTVDLGGGGGYGGNRIPMTTAFVGAHAGGSGGYLVIQAFDILVTGNLYANGGGGGAGYTGSVQGSPGADASRASTYGGAGGTVQAGEGAGGNGAFGSSAGSPGKHPPSSGTAGAGGGGVGFLQTYTPAGMTPTLTPSDVSPALQPNLTIPTK